MRLPKTYEPEQYEQDIYKLWEASGAFRPAEHGHGRFSIVLPPPNATGKLHVGHAIMLAIEDTLVRYHRMQGRSVLWVPGTDHAAIATNAIMEQQLEKEGTDKHKLGRDQFLNRLHEYVDSSIDTIRSQVKAMGASVDWELERYTMEPAMNRIVGEVFIKMFNDGLIYRGHRIVNWDPKLETTVADDELEHVAEKTVLYTLQYGPFQIATARPETKFGDKYVVMHPDDDRYQKYKEGDTFEAEWINGKVKATVVKDEVIDPKFGTGVMTITPWHDATDFDIAERHKLDKEQIIGEDGKLLDIAGEFKGLPIEAARPKIVAKLKAKGLLVKEESNYVHNIAVNYRGKGVVEPQIKEQWFIDVNKPAVHWKGHKRSLKEVMQAVIKDGDIKLLPNRFEKTYFHWIDNLRDWCISRQIWWGHRIPVWYKHQKAGSRKQEAEGESNPAPSIHVGWEPPDQQGWEQDPDTLDTWFSSALWTWSTLIHPEIALDPKNSLEDMLKKSDVFKSYHPTDLLETGYDILFFWVARMILMTTYVTDQVPFKTVYLHGLVRLKDGRKMSKSDPDNIIDPLDIIPKYGTDALRLALIAGQAPGNDIRIYEEKIGAQRNFANKLWNVARFVEDKIGQGVKPDHIKPKSAADYWILVRLAATAEIIDKDLEDYQIGRAVDSLYHFIWDDLADWYVEVSKIELNPGVLAHVLEATLKLAHPFAPFVTETIWDTLQWDDSLLISSRWPEIAKGDQHQAAAFTEVQALVSEIRNLRSQLLLTQNTLYFKDGDWIKANSDLIVKLTGLAGCRQVSSGKGLHLTNTKEEAWLDVEEQKAHDYLMKLIKQREALTTRIKHLEQRLSNKDYLRQAPHELVEETRNQLTADQATLAKFDREIEVFEKALKQY